MLGLRTSGLSNKFSILDVKFQFKVVFVYFLYRIVAYRVICSQLKILSMPMLGWKKSYQSYY